MLSLHCLLDILLLFFTSWNHSCSKKEVLQCAWCLHIHGLETLPYSVAKGQVFLTYHFFVVTCKDILILHVQACSKLSLWFFVGSGNKGPASKRRRTSSRSQDEEFVITVSGTVKMFAKVFFLCSSCTGWGHCVVFLGKTLNSLSQDSRFKFCCMTSQRFP